MFPSQGKKSDDHLSVGFAQAAFDPSLYAGKKILQQLQQASKGCCYWCESLIEHDCSQSSQAVSHYRPPEGVLENGILRRNTYYSLAYDTSNLLYSCTKCSEQYKGLQFPLLDQKRMPQASQSQESPALVNPYTDSPRDFIRFNPINGQAFAFDRVQAFYLQTGKGGDGERLSVHQIEELLWSDPRNIPLQKDHNGNAISLTDIDKAYQNWMKTLTEHESAGLSRGLQSINILGLNRPSLIRARVAHLQAVRGLYLEHPNVTESANIDELSVCQYSSLTTDALHTWQLSEQRNSTHCEGSESNTENKNQQTNSGTGATQEEEK